MDLLLETLEEWAEVLKSEPDVIQTLVALREEVEGGSDMPAETPEPSP